MATGTDLPDGDFVYRRIPAANHWVKRDGSVDYAAFLPNKGDAEGLSLSRCNSAAAAAATGKRGKKFYAVSLSVGLLKAKGLKVIADAADHAFIEGWTTGTRDDAHIRSLATWLTTVCGRAEGPFDGEWEPPTS